MSLHHIFSYHLLWHSLVQLVLDRPNLLKKVQVGKDQGKAQSETYPHSKNRDGKKTKLTIKYLYHENIL